MSPDSNVPTTAERLRQLGRIARRRLPVLVGVTLAVVLAVTLASSGGDDQYRATAKLLLSGSDVVDPPATGTSPANNDPERDLNTKVGLIRIESVARRVERQLRLGMPVSRLLEKVTATPEGSSNIVDVKATDSSPARAAAIANAFAKQYVAFRRKVAQSALQQAAASLQKQYANLSVAEQSGAAGAALRNQLQTVNIDSAVQTGGAAVVLPAASPRSPTAPHTVRTAAIGTLLGLVLAVMIVVLLEFTDRRVRDEEAVAAAGEARVVARIPRCPFGSRGVTQPDRLTGDAYDHLAGEIRRAAQLSAFGTVLVTSPGRGDGKTRVALGLACALAQLGSRVIVVQADAPAGAQDQSVRQNGGLTGVVAGHVTLADAFVEVDVETLVPRRDAQGVAAGIGSVAILAAGDAGPSTRQPPTPLDMGSVMRSCLSRPEGAAAIGDCASVADFVLIDAPPTDLLHAAPTLIDAIDVTMLVCRIGWTGRADVTRAVNTLEALECPLLGVVVTGAPRRTGGAPHTILRAARAAVLELATPQRPGTDARSTGRSGPR
jgi:polysaccharide biosynthesis transport protein